VSGTVVAFGEALIDRFPDRDVVAGAPVHVVAHLARRGWNAHLVTRLGRDANGARIREELERRNVDTAFVETDDALPTGTVTIEMEGTSHSFEIHRPVAWDAIEGSAELPAHDAFVYGSLAARAERSEAALRRLLAQPSSALRVFDVNLRPPDVSPGPLRDGLRAADVLKLNEDEAVEVGGLLGLPDIPESWFERSERLTWICVTRGEVGATPYKRGEASPWSLPSRKVEVVDTVGAGDAFTAGLLEGLVEGWEPERALENAASFAAAIVAQRGGLP